MDEEAADQTPLPGVRLDEAQGRAMYERMQSLYMDPFSLDGKPSNCAFANREPSGWHRLADRAWMADGTPVIFIQEAGRVRSWPQEVHAATMGQVRAYYEVRNPWEEYDVYILPADLAWCFVVTHDDACFFARPKDAPADGDTGASRAKTPS